MSIGKKKLLAAFLEKDNLKLLAYDVFGTRAVRTFAGQINFSAEVVKDAYIADALKFTGQVKMAISAKLPLQAVSDLVLFMPTDKTFSKSLPTSDAVDSFIQSLPYFAEELVLTSSQVDKKTTHVAFEKKLVEDFQRPFMESSKKITAVKSGINVLGAEFVQEGKYFLLAPLEKEIAMAVVENGAVLELASFGKEVFSARFSEFILNHNLDSVRLAYTVGTFDADLASKIRTERGIEVVSVASGDIYDATVSAYLRSLGGRSLGNVLGKIGLQAISSKIPARKPLLLMGAGLVGIILVVMLVRGITGTKSGANTPAVTPVATTPTVPPAPEPKPADYKVRVLNGTLVEGEAGRLADKIKELGFEIKETKNATTAGFVTSRLRTAADVPTTITEKIKAVLTELYDSVSVESLPAGRQDLASDSAGVKIEVIIGKKK